MCHWGARVESSSWGVEYGVQALRKESGARDEASRGLRGGAKVGLQLFVWKIKQ